MKNTNPHPEYWYIVATEDNYNELEAWRRTVATSSHRHRGLFRVGMLLLSFHPDGSYYYAGSAHQLELNDHFKRNREYKEITLEQFREITNSKPMSKSTIQISRTLLNEYYDASTTSQREYLVEHFKLDGTTTVEAICGLYELACSTWKPKIRANHPECFPVTLKKYKITQSSPAIQVWEYEVEAASEEEAIEKVCNGEVEHSNYHINSDNDETEITEMEIQLIK